MFWAPANEAGEYDPTSTTYQWIQNKNFGNDFYTRAANGATIATNQQALEDAQGQAMVFTLPTATYDAARGGVWTLTDENGNYSFDNLPVRYTYGRTKGLLGGITTSTMPPPSTSPAIRWRCSATTRTPPCP